MSQIINFFKNGKTVLNPKIEELQPTQKFGSGSSKKARLWAAPAPVKSSASQQ